MKKMTKTYIRKTPEGMEDSIKINYIESRGILLIYRRSPIYNNNFVPSAFLDRCTKEEDIISCSAYNNDFYFDLSTGKLCCNNEL